MANLDLAQYVVATHGGTGPEVFEPGKLLYYVFARNGVFIRAARAEMTAAALVASCEVRGLARLTAFADVHLPRVPAQIVSACFNRARSVCVSAARPREILFYLIHEGGVWRMVEPDQVADAGGVRPSDPSDADCARSVIELHSHHEMAAFWSDQDNADESGFKLYAVMGRIFSKPRLRVRVGVFGHFHELNASDIFEIPEGVNCGEEKDAREEDDRSDD